LARDCSSPVMRIVEERTVGIAFFIRQRQGWFPTPDTFLLCPWRT
ncbi:hypothetical protein AVEN_177112-1, partial [Araneus ventricosus]